MNMLKVEKNFFSEEKKQKTFMSLSPFYPEVYAKHIKVFCLVCSKKKVFGFFFYVSVERARIAWITAEKSMPPCPALASAS
jgi:hypothetical protein